MIVFGLSLVFLTGCQESSPVTCKPASNPFTNLLSINESEYWGGYYPNIEIGQVCEFEGQVSKGEMYQLEFTDGLAFCLIPDIEGWTIAVSGSSQIDCSENYGVFVTPP